MTDQDIEAIERATIAAVSPEAVQALDGWLLPFDGGTVGRAKSAVPLSHSAINSVAAGALLERLQAQYASQNLPCMLRLADVDGFAPLRHVLTQHGYVSSRPTWVQVGTVDAMRQVCAQAPADVDNAPDAAWAALFLGEGFDPVDGASRVRSLSRAQGSAYASLRQEGKTVAAGAGAFSHGWASVHGMRTAVGYRGQGLAGRVLAALAQAAAQKGLRRVFLQVEASNPAAQALYRRAGFETAWSYMYWSRPVSS